jgi:formate-nitrite transporter family protein
MSNSNASAKDQVELTVPKKTYREILHEEVKSGWSELNRPGAGLFLSGLSAGLDVGFSLLLMAVTLSLAGDDLHPLALKLLLAAMYAVGFVFVNVGRSELFTEHTTLMIFPLLDRKVSAFALGRVWLLVYSGNLLGAAIFALLASRIGPALGIAKMEVFGHIAENTVHFPWWVLLTSGILAGWMMGLLSWLVAATQDTISQIACVGLIAGAIGFASLHHCVAGSVEVLAGAFAGHAVSLCDYGCFLLWATAGNILGGGIFASLKYSHATRHPEPVDM